MFRVAQAAALVLFSLAILVGCRTSAGRLLSGVLSNNITISTGTFSQGPSPAPVGACCISTGDCLTVTASDCANFSGTFFGEGIICEIAPCESQY